jgi:hypothetical protein
MEELSPFVRVVLVQLHLVRLVGEILLLDVSGGFGRCRSVDQLQDLRSAGTAENLPRVDA